MDYSKITDFLYIGTQPGAADYSVLQDLGVRLVINMRWEQRPPRAPVSPPSLWLPTMDSPFFPIPIPILHRGALAAVEIIENGGAVYSHCQAGMHRSVALGSSIMILLGYKPEEAMRLIKQQRAVADPYIWYIRRRIERFADFWQNQSRALPAPD